MLMDKFARVDVYQHDAAGIGSGTNASDVPLNRIDNSKYCSLLWVRGGQSL